MSMSLFVLLISLPLLTRTFPVHSRRDILGFDLPQAIFDAVVDDDGPNVSDVLDTSPVWFAPEHVPANASSPGPIVAAYYPDWTASQLSPEMVDFNRLDWIDFGQSCLPFLAIPALIFRVW